MGGAGDAGVVIADRLLALPLQVVVVEVQEVGDEAARQNLWQHYFRRLVGLARTKLREGSKRMADEEDSHRTAAARDERHGERVSKKLGGEVLQARLAHSVDGRRCRALKSTSRDATLGLIEQNCCFWLRAGT